MHGTSQRTAYTLKEKRKNLPNWLYKLANFFKIKPKRTWEMISGTRRVTLTDFNKNTGFYGSEAFRKPHHDFFDGKLHKGEEVFYEVLGYVNESTLIMGEVSNKKTNDKEFIKQYGETTKFTYGCKPNESIIRVYRMTMTNEDGYVVAKKKDEAYGLLDKNGNVLAEAEGKYLKLPPEKITSENVSIDEEMCYDIKDDITNENYSSAADGIKRLDKILQAIQRL